MDTIAWLTISTIAASIVAVLNGITALVVGVSRFRWSKVISEAKEAQIEGLKTEVQNLRELTPMRLQEYAKATASVLGEQIDGLEEQLRQEREKRESWQTTVVESDVEALPMAIAEQDELVQDLQDALKEAQQDRDAADRMSQPGNRSGFWAKMADAFFAEIPLAGEEEPPREAGDQQS